VTARAERRTNAEWSEHTRTALLAAARAAFTEHGYEGASLNDIASAANLTKGAIYHHYTDKRALFRAVFEDIERQIVDGIECVAARSPSALTAVLRGCEAFLDIVLDEQVSRIVLVDGPSVLGWSRWRAIDYATGGRSLRAGLDAAMRSGEIAALDVDALTSLISGAVNELALAIVEAPDRTRARRAARSALQRLIKGLRRSAEDSRPPRP